MKNENILILGAGQAGHWTAMTLRKEGHSGKITIIGEEPHIPYERPPLSKDILSGDKDPQSCYFNTPEEYTENGIDIRIDTVGESIDLQQQTLRLANNETINFDKLVITTGSSVIRPPIPGASLDGVFYLRSLEDCLTLRQQLTKQPRVVLIGGGYVGMEVAATARKLNCDVTVVELQEQIMARVVPPAMSDYLANIHVEHGVSLLTNTEVTAIEKSEQSLLVNCSNGQSLPADVVIIGVGIRPNDAIASQAGLDVDNGILVNEYGETSHANVYAAGDVCRHYNPILDRAIRLESWQNAQNQAIVVAKRICETAEKPYAEIPWFWSVQYDKRIQITGAQETWKNLYWRGTADDKSMVVFSLDDDNRIEAAVGINAPLEIRLTRQMIAQGKQTDPAILTDTGIKFMQISKM